MTILLRLVVVCLLASGLTGCVAALVGGTAAGAYYAGQDDRPVGGIISDGSITSSIKTKYITDRYVKAFDVSVSTYDGTVTLKGEVDSYIAKQQAEVIARRTKGVTQVINAIEVNSESTNNR